jgi:hypothetical protein
MPYEMYSSEDKVMNYSKELYHHGILGQRWGFRRFQNKDGSLTSAGKNAMVMEILKEKKTFNRDQ